MQVGWNLRDKKIASEPMTYLRKKDFPFNVSTTSISRHAAVAMLT